MVVGSEKMRLPWALVGISLALFGVQLVLTFFGLGGSGAAVIDVVYLALAVIAAVSCFCVSRRISSREASLLRMFWLVLGVAFVLFAVGDAYWAYEEVVLGNLSPLAAFSDLSWTLAYGVWIGAVFWFVSAWRRPSWRLWVFLLALVLGTPVVLYVSGVMSKFTFGGVITTLYVAFDIALLLLLGYCVLRGLDEGRDVLPWLLLGGVVLARLLFDFLYSGLVSLEIYETGGAIDLLYSLSYVLVPVAAAAQSRRPKF